MIKSGFNIISFGEIVWDVYPDKATLGGAPLNFAAHAQMQGATAFVLSAVGDDVYGQWAIKEIQKLGISTDFISVKDAYPTGKCTVTLSKDGIPSFDLAAVSAYDFTDIQDTIPNDCYAICFGTLALRGKRNRRTLDLLLSRCSFSEVFTDINIRPPYYSKESVDFVLSRATIVKLSNEDMMRAGDVLFEREYAEEEAVRVISKKYSNIKIILLTRGERGSLCYECKTQKFTYCSAVKTEVVSTVGAGDSFGATFLVQYMKTKDIAYSMAIASKVSAFVVCHKEAIPTDTKAFIKPYRKRD